MTISWSPALRVLPRHGARDGPYRYDAHIAAAAAAWFPRFLTIPDGERAGQPFKLEPWQDFYVRCLYGWRHATTGLRRYKRGLIGIPRGNGKSTLGAGFGLKALIGDGVPTPLVIGAGTDRENAGIIFSAAAVMAEGDARLRRRLMVRPAAKRIIRRAKPGSSVPGRGLYRVLAAEAQHAHGYHPTARIVDDLQAQPSREFIAVMDTSQVTVADPLAISFMTAGYSRATIGWEEWEHAQRVLEDPALDEELLVALYYALATDDLEDPKIWRKANPNLGVSVQEAFIRSVVREMAERPSKRAEKLRLHFDIWTEGEFLAWIAPEAWRANEGEVDEEDLRGRPCFVGVSAPSVTDVAAVVYVFPPVGDDGYSVVMDAFVPADSLQKLELRDGIAYEPFIAGDWLEKTDGDIRDDERIVASVRSRAIDDGYLISDIAVNPRNASSLMTALGAEGFEVTQVLPSFGTMSPAMNELERLVMAHDIAHGGNRMLAWMMGNTQARANADGDLKPDVERSLGNITGPIAMLMALSRTVATEGASGWAAV